FLGLEPQAAEVTEYDVGGGALLARRRRQRGELEEEVDRLGHAPILRGSAQTATRSPARARARSSAAPTKPLKSGAARVGRDLNLGGNGAAADQGRAGRPTVLSEPPLLDRPAHDETGLDEPFAVRVVHLVAMPVALVNRRLAVQVACARSVGDLDRL